MSIRHAFKREPLLYHQCSSSRDLDSAVKRLRYYHERNPQARIMVLYDFARDRWIIGRVA